MRRCLVVGLVLLGGAFASAQNPSQANPQPPMQPGQPVTSQQQQQQQQTDPATMAPIPPTFAPGGGMSGTMAQSGPDMVHLSGGAMANLLVERADPVYPSAAKANGIQGAVVLSARIGKNGHVVNLAVISGPPLLQRAAVDAVKGWVYRPYLLNGAPVVVQTTVTVDFQLPARTGEQSAVQ